MRLRCLESISLRSSPLYWLNATRGDMWAGIEAFVGDDHPALAARHSGVSIVDLARQKQPLEAYPIRPQNRHYAIVGHAAACRLRLTGPGRPELTDGAGRAVL